MPYRSKSEAYSAERKMQDAWAKTDFKAEKMIEEIHKAAIDRMQKQIDGYYLRYANREGISLAEAKKRIKNFNVGAWAEKAAQAVKYKDFSPETNVWLKTYNSKMYISRVELLKAELEIELQNMYSQDHQLIDKHLEDAYIAELKRQAGILGNSASGSSRRLKEVVNADFYGTDFSQKIWGRNGLYESTRKELFKSLANLNVDMMGYRQERNRLMKLFNATQYEAMRLLKTESSRVRNTAEMDSYKANGFDYYVYVTESGACSHCAAWEGKAIPLDKGSMGYNLPPLHPNCRCSTYGIIRMDKKDGTSNMDEYDIVED